MPTDETSPRAGPRPRTLLAFLAAIMALQAIYAAMDLFGSANAPTTPLQLVVSIGFFAYVAMIVAFAYGVWRQTWWTWHVAVAVAATGLALAALRIADGDTFEQHGLGMLIDGALLFYLQRPSIKGLFGR
jgi:hypothetical protein